LTNFCLDLHNLAKSRIGCNPLQYIAVYVQLT
jgi:hypothetical protein